MGEYGKTPDNKQTQKEPGLTPLKDVKSGFWRGLRDLNSRAPFETYSLSRGI